MNCETLNVAHAMLDMGMHPVRLRERSKAAHEDGWPTRIHTHESVDAEFECGENVGVLLGEHGGWVVDIDLDSFPAGASATQVEQIDPDVALDLARVSADMPAPSCELLDLICATADVAEAQRHARQSSAAFYRGLGELRCWLHAGGLRPPAPTSVRASSTGTP